MLGAQPRLLSPAKGRLTTYTPHLAPMACSDRVREEAPPAGDAHVTEADPGWDLLPADQGGDGSPIDVVIPASRQHPRRVVP